MKWTKLLRLTIWATNSSRLLALLLLFTAPPILSHSQSSSILQSAREAMEAKQYPQAEQLYRKALAQDSSSGALLTDLALSLQMQGRSAEAIHYYSLALKQGYVPETYALLAEEKCRMGDLDGLRPMLARIYRQERKNLRVLSAVAPCFLDVDEPIESAVIYQTLLNSADVQKDLAMVQLAKSYLRSGQFFAEKLSKSPHAEPFLNALRQASANGTADARSAFAEAAKLSPYFRSNLSWTEAVERWRQHPQDASLLYLLSVLSGEEGMHQIAICDERFPGSPYLEQFHADVLADQGQSDQAAVEYEDLMRQHPDLSDLRYSLGLLREKRQEWQAASTAFRQQLDAYPNDERAAAHLSKCMLEMKQYNELEQFLEPRMHATHPPQWASLHLAEAQEKVGEPEAAIKTLVAAESEPDPDKLVHYRLTHLYSVTGHAADAKREFALFQSASGK